MRQMCRCYVKYERYVHVCCMDEELPCPFNLPWTHFAKDTALVDVDMKVLRRKVGTATPPCPDHAGSAPNTLTGAEVVLLCRMFLRGRIGRIELTIHASGGRHRGSHRAAVVAYMYVPLIFGSSKTPVGRTSPYVPRVSACSRQYRLQFGSL